MVEQHIYLDLTPAPVKVRANVSQYDTGARVLVFHLRDCGKAFTPPDGTVAIVHGIKPDETYFSYTAEIDGDTVIADCTEQMTAVSGVATCEIMLTDSDGQVGSCNFVLVVEESPITGAVVSDSEIAAIQELTAQAAASAIAAAESESNAADSATAAAASAESASTSATSASTSATSAAASASSASASASAASGYLAEVESNATEATEAAQTAQSAATTATTAATSANSSASAAASSASSASTSASTASAAATSASNSASAAETSETNAAASESSASESASTASTSATTATTAAQSASASATAAASSASAASTSETNAATSATNAAASETAAASSATSAAESAASAAQSAADVEKLKIYVTTDAAAVTSIVDGADDVAMTSVIAEIEPAQDLNGYDSPWPAGGGKNIMPPPSITGNMRGVTVTTSGDVITLDGTATAYGQVVSSESFTLSAGTYVLSIFTVSGSGSNVIAQLRSTEGTSTYASTTSSVSFTLTEDTELVPRVTYASGYSYSSKGISFMVSSGDTAPSEYSPYENICPISGWDGVTVTRAGANIFDMSGVTIGKNWTGGTATNRAFGSFSWNIGTTYKIAIYGLTADMKTIVIDMAQSQAGTQAWSEDVLGNDPHIITHTAAANYIGIQFQFKDNRDLPSDYLNGIYAVVTPAAIDTYPITFPTPPGTVYGGSLDLVSGVLTVDRAVRTFDGSETSWTLQSINSSGIANFKYSTISDYIMGVQNDAITDKFSPQTSLISDTTEAGFLLNVAGLFFIRIQSSLASTVSEFTAWLADNPVTLVYALATPITYQLTAQEITSLLGSNTLWADCGNTQITYCADTKLYIDNAIASAVAALS